MVHYCCPVIELCLSIIAFYSTEGGVCLLDSMFIFTKCFSLNKRLAYVSISAVGTKNPVDVYFVWVLC